MIFHGKGGRRLLAYGRQIFKFAPDRSPAIVSRKSNLVCSEPIIWCAVGEIRPYVAIGPIKLLIIHRYEV